MNYSPFNLTEFDFGLFVKTVLNPLAPYQNIRFYATVLTNIQFSVILVDNARLGATVVDKARFSGQ